MLALRGVLAIAFGILVFFRPALAWVMILGLFAAYAFLMGFSLLGPRSVVIPFIWAKVVGADSGRRGGLTAGILIPVRPEVTGLVLLYFIAFWAIVTGMLEIAVAIRLQREIEGEWALGLAGVLLIAFGITAIPIPAAGALTIAWLIGTCAIVFGALMLIVAVRLRSTHRATNVEVGTAA